MSSNIRTKTTNRGLAAASRQLSQEDQQQLRTYQQRCQLLRDRTLSISRRYQSGLYVVGRPGSGKSHVVTETLKEGDSPNIYRNGRMTPMGLYEELASHPEHVIVIDDIPSLLGERMAQQILMAALGGEPGKPRPVTYTTKSKDERGRSFFFSGGLIAISNVPLRRDPLADAIVSRTVLLEHEPTDGELAAVMRFEATKGFEDMSSAECRTVVEFVIDESLANDYRMDLRFMRKGFQDFRQYKHGDSTRTWQDLIRSSMKQILRDSSHPVRSKQEQLSLDRELVHRAMQKFPGNTARQMAESGLKKTKFYEMRRQVAASNLG